MASELTPEAIAELRFGVVRGAIACGYEASCRVRSNGVLAYSDDRDLVTCKECYRIILASGGTVRGVKQP